MLPITSKLKKADVFAIITELEKEIEIRTATGASIYRKPEMGIGYIGLVEVFAK